MINFIIITSKEDYTKISTILKLTLDEITLTEVGSYKLGKNESYTVTQCVVYPGTLKDKKNIYHFILHSFNFVCLRFEKEENYFIKDEDAFVNFIFDIYQVEQQIDITMFLKDMLTTSERYSLITGPSSSFDINDALEIFILLDNGFYPHRIRIDENSKELLNKKRNFMVNNIKTRETISFDISVLLPNLKRHFIVIKNLKKDS